MGLRRVVTWLPLVAAGLGMAGGSARAQQAPAAGASATPPGATTPAAKTAPAATGTGTNAPAKTAPAASARGTAAPPPTPSSTTPTTPTTPTTTTPATTTPPTTTTTAPATRDVPPSGDGTPAAPPAPDAPPTTDATPPPPPPPPPPPAAPAPPPPPKPLTAIGSASWTRGVGLVDGAHASSTSPSAGSADADVGAAGRIPSLPSTSLTTFGFRIIGGADKLVNAEELAPMIGGALRYEVRHKDSVLAPWAEGGTTMTVQSEGSSAGTLLDIFVRGGVDVHPGREPKLGIGPFLGYRQLHARSNDASVMLQGVDVGGQLHFRTDEAAGGQSAFDATLYGFMQGPGAGDISNRGFLGAMLATGGAVKFMMLAEGCTSSPETCFPRQLRLAGGLGGAW